MRLNHSPIWEYILMDDNAELTGMTVTLLSAFVAHNNVRAEDLPGLIGVTHQALGALKSSAAEAIPAEVVSEFFPVVSVRKSLASNDHILSMIDGKPYKTLRRHLGRHSLTPEQYRERYKLSATYPMVAPGYSAARSAMAKSIGLGRKASATPEAQPDTKPAKKPRAKAASKSAVTPA